MWLHYTLIIAKLGLDEVCKEKGKSVFKLVGHVEVLSIKVATPPKMSFYQQQ